MSAAVSHFTAPASASREDEALRAPFRCVFVMRASTRPRADFLSAGDPRRASRRNRPRSRSRPSREMAGSRTHRATTPVCACCAREARLEREKPALRGRSSSLRVLPVEQGERTPHAPHPLPRRRAGLALGTAFGRSRTAAACVRVRSTLAAEAPRAPLETATARVERRRARARAPYRPTRSSLPLRPACAPALRFVPAPVRCRRRARRLQSPSR